MNRLKRSLQWVARQRGDRVFWVLVALMLASSLLLLLGFLLLLIGFGWPGVGSDWGESGCNWLLVGAMMVPVWWVLGRIYVDRW